RATSIVLAFLGYFLWMVITTIKTPVGVPAWDFVESMGKVVLPFIIGVTLIDSLAKVKLLAWVIALSHSYLAFEFNMSYFDGFNMLQENGFATMDNICVAIALVTASGLTFFLGLYAQSWLLKLLAFGGAALMAHAIMFSFSRGGVLALICTGVATFFLIP